MNKKLKINYQIENYDMISKLRDLYKGMFPYSIINETDNKIYVELNSKSTSFAYYDIKPKSCTYRTAISGPTLITIYAYKDDRKVILLNNFILFKKSKITVYSEEEIIKLDEIKIRIKSTINTKVLKNYKK